MSNYYTYLLVVLFDNLQILFIIEVTKNNIKIHL